MSFKNFLEISVIIPTHNSQLTIERCLMSLKNQEFPKENFEIIIIDDGSSDETLNIVKKIGVEQIIMSNPCSPGKARNTGAKNAKGKILAFIDSDCKASTTWLSAISKGLKNNDVITGTILNGNSKSNIAWAEYLVEFGLFLDYKRQFEVRFFPGCNGALAKSTFERTEGFSEEFLSEDVLFGKNLLDIGIKTIFLPQMQIYHLCRTDLVVVCSNMKKLGKFGVRARKKDHTIDHSILYRHNYYLPVIFSARLLRCALNSLKAKKTIQFTKSFLFVIKCLNSYCSGILEELNKK